MGSYSTIILLLLITSIMNTSITGEINATSMAANTTAVFTTADPASYPDCPSDADCELLGANCLEEITNCNITCKYGETTEVAVQVLNVVPCAGERNHSRNLSCQFCYQLPEEYYSCSTNTSCNSIGTHSTRVYTATCEVKPNVLCLGKRKFFKRKLCYWTNGYSWTTTMILSITAGGFGADRFYLGHWQEGIGKLFSFGGLGVWTLIDVILISIGYITPADGSVYTYRANYTSQEYSTNLFIFN